MAITNPATPISGSIGGETHSHNRGGPYVRRRGIPINPNSTKQQFARAVLSTLSGNWSGLTSAQRAAWKAFADANPVVNRLGQARQLSGQQAYVQLNARLIGAGTTASATPPSTTGPDMLLTATVVFTAPATIALTYTATPAPAGNRIVVWQTLPGTAGRDPNLNQARLVGYSAAAAASPQSFTTPYAGAVGQTCNVFAGVMDASGRITPLLKVPVVLA